MRLVVKIRGEPYRLLLDLSRSRLTGWKKLALQLKEMRTSERVLGIKISLNLCSSLSMPEICAWTSPHTILLAPEELVLDVKWPTQAMIGQAGVVIAVVSGNKAWAKSPMLYWEDLDNRMELYETGGNVGKTEAFAGREGHALSPEGGGLVCHLGDNSTAGGTGDRGSGQDAGEDVCGWLQEAQTGSPAW